MTEQQWLQCQNLQPMLVWLHNQETLTERKARLFAVACCRRVWRLLSHEQTKNAVDTVERFADLEVSRKDLYEAIADVDGVVSRLDSVSDQSVSFDFIYHAAWAVLAAMNSITFGVCAEQAAIAVAWEKAGDDYRPTAGLKSEREEGAAQADVLRDILGNPFRPLALSPSLLNNNKLVALALAAYDNRILPAGNFDPARLADLANALEDVGCTDAALLGHLRREGEHVRGCWALDHILQKE